MSDFVVDNGILLKYIGKDDKVIIPEGVSIIGERTFNDNKILSSVVIPDSVKIIEKRAFSNCAYLDNIIIPKNVVRIKNNAFSHCPSLENVSIYDGVKRIEAKAFYGCVKLKYNEYDTALYLGNENTQVWDTNELIPIFKDCRLNYFTKSSR